MTVDDWAMRLLWTIFVLFVGILIGSLATEQANAHMNGRSGWQYPNECCRNHNDCQWIQSDWVEYGEHGITVTIPAGWHDHLPDGGSEFFPYGDTRLRTSGDEDVHACIGQYQDLHDGSTKSTWRCFYDRWRSW